MTNNKPICLFDSGIGGFTVLKKLIQEFPNEKYIYFADLARVPFGDKTKDEIKSIANEIIEWLLKFDPKLIVMACNTSSALLNTKEKTYPVPIYGMIDSCAKNIAKSNYKKITVWATKLVVESHEYKKQIQNYNPAIQVEEISCPKLVPMIEGLNFTLEQREEIISEYTNNTSTDSEGIILGCTHYPLIAEDIKKSSKKETIDPTDYLVQDLLQQVPTMPSHSRDLPRQASTTTAIYTTAQKDKIERFAKLYLNEEIKATLVTLNKISV